MSNGRYPQYKLIEEYHLKRKNSDRKRSNRIQGENHPVDMTPLFMALMVFGALGVTTAQLITEGVEGRQLTERKARQHSKTNPKEHALPSERVNVDKNKKNNKPSYQSKQQEVKKPIYEEMEEPREVDEEKSIQKKNLISLAKKALILNPADNDTIEILKKYYPDELTHLHSYYKIKMHETISRFEEEKINYPAAEDKIKILYSLLNSRIHIRTVLNLAKDVVKKIPQHNSALNHFIDYAEQSLVNAESLSLDDGKKEVKYLDTQSKFLLIKLSMQAGLDKETFLTFIEYCQKALDDLINEEKELARKYYITNQSLSQLNKKLDEFIEEERTRLHTEAFDISNIEIYDAEKIRQSLQNNLENYFFTKQKDWGKVSLLDMVTKSLTMPGIDTHLIKQLEEKRESALKQILACYEAKMLRVIKIFEEDEIDFVSAKDRIKFFFKHMVMRIDFEKVIIYIQSFSEQLPRDILKINESVNYIEAELVKHDALIDHQYDEEFKQLKTIIEFFIIKLAKRANADISPLQDFIKNCQIEIDTLFNEENELARVNFRKMATQEFSDSELLEQSVSLGLNTLDQVLEREKINLQKDLFDGNNLEIYNREQVKQNLHEKLEKFNTKVREHFNEKRAHKRDLLIKGPLIVACLAGVIGSCACRNCRNKKSSKKDGSTTQKSTKQIAEELKANQQEEIRLRKERQAKNREKAKKQQAKHVQSVGAKKNSNSNTKPENIPSKFAMKELTSLIDTIELQLTKLNEIKVAIEKRFQILDTEHARTELIYRSLSNTENANKIKRLLPKLDKCLKQYNENHLRHKFKDDLLELDELIRDIDAVKRLKEYDEKELRDKFKDDLLKLNKLSNEVDAAKKLKYVVEKSILDLKSKLISFEESFKKQPELADYESNLKNILNDLDPWLRSTSKSKSSTNKQPANSVQNIFFSTHIPVNVMQQTSEVEETSAAPLIAPPNPLPTEPTKAATNINPFKDTQDNRGEEEVKEIIRKEIHNPSVGTSGSETSYVYPVSVRQIKPIGDTKKLQLHLRALNQAHSMLNPKNKLNEDELNENELNIFNILYHLTKICNKFDSNYSNNLQTLRSSFVHPKLHPNNDWSNNPQILKTFVEALLRQDKDRNIVAALENVIEIPAVKSLLGLDNNPAQPSKVGMYKKRGLDDSDDILILNSLIDKVKSYGEALNNDSGQAERYANAIEYLIMRIAEIIRDLKIYKSIETEKILGFRNIVAHEGVITIEAIKRFINHNFKQFREKKDAIDDQLKLQKGNTPQHQGKPKVT